MAKRENTLLTNKHILICSGQSFDHHPELENLRNNFCGIFATSTDGLVTDANTLIYLCGDINSIAGTVRQFPSKAIYAIRELSRNYDSHEGIQVIGLGCVPINIHGVGVLFRKLFEEDDYDQRIRDTHTLQSLTESDKPNNALRRGFYASRVKRTPNGTASHLMRCSSNFDGPTKNFKPIDEEIVTEVNRVTASFFEEPTELNHILAQTYFNSAAGKAKISPHSDKTEDMDPAGVIVFTSFYRWVNGKVQSKTDPFDVCYRTSKGAHKETSVLTTLHFKLKDCVKDDSLVKEFSVILYPNSVFIIPLSTNRLYVHETRPSVLPFDKIPVRTSYVIKCSTTEALYKDGTVRITQKSPWQKLEPMTRADLTQLRTLYFHENTTDQYMDYPFIGFSANSGDYLEPEV